MANRSCTWFDRMWKYIGIFIFVAGVLYGGYKFYFAKHYKILTRPAAQQLGI